MGEATDEQNQTDSPRQRGNAVLCVDLDGCLIGADLSWESLVLGMRRAPLATVKYLFGGKPHLKAKLAEATGTEIDISKLPYDDAVINLVTERRQGGWRTELVSGSNATFVKKVADYLGIFDAAIGSTAEHDLAGNAKADFLSRRHPAGFSYVGNGAADIPVWQAASERIAAKAQKPVIDRCRAQGLDLEILVRGANRLSAIIECMRLHQWSKNLLIFTAFLLSSDSRTVMDLFWLIVAFLAFGLAASGSYVVNDIVDIQSDRQHRTKAGRPLARGALPIPLGIAISAVLLILAAAIASAVGWLFLTMVLTYITLSLAYSLVLKVVSVIDVLTIAVLFCVRIFAGHVAIAVPISPWLLVFSIFFFASLAFAKRYSEISNKRRTAGHTLPGRGYLPEDHLFVLGFGVALASCSLMVFLLYAFSGESVALRYPATAMVCLGLITYWIMRIWLLTLRGEMNEDPVLFVVHDRASLVVVVLIILTLATDAWLLTSG